MGMNAFRFARWVGGAFLLALVTVGASAQEATLPAAIAELEQQLVAAVAKAEPSLVAVARVRKTGRDAGGGLARLQRLLAPSEESAEQGAAPAELGTGVIVDPRGLILTTYHLLGEAPEHDYAVWFERRAWPAKVKAADPWFDLAILEVEADAWPAIRFAEPVELKRGQFAIALGDPYAIAREGHATSAWGSVANLREAAPRSERAGPSGRETVHHYGTLIQTDARLEAGASGGALVNLRGEMIGLTNGVISRAGSERPGSFAIPVDEHFQRTLTQLKQGRVPDYGFLGLAPTAVAANEREKGKQGAVVSEIVPATPAARSGLQSGDLITAIDGEPIKSDRDLVRHVSSLHAGMLVTLQVQRPGAFARQLRTLSIKTKLTKKPPDEGSPALSEQPPRQWRGLQIDYATAAPRFRELARELDAAGCVGVVAVERDSAAWQAGFRPGDFISHVSKTRVATPDEFYVATGTLEGEVQLKLATGASVRTVPAPAIPPEAP
jgi:serine protease Do